MSDYINRKALLEEMNAYKFDTVNNMARRTEHTVKAHMFELVERQPSAFNLEVVIEQVKELDVYYDNDYFSSNNEPMVLKKDVLEILSGNTQTEVKGMNRVEKKQIPKKVIYEDIGYNQYQNVNVYSCTCPSCGLHIIEFDDDDVASSESDEPEEMFHDCMVHHAYIGLNNFCNRCGQRLAWKS